MTNILVTAVSIISNALLDISILFRSHHGKSFSDLPDDVLLEIFTCIEFSSIVALRQTCRRCYRVSKTQALWLNTHRWITEDADDWRANLAKSRTTLSAAELETQVVRMVRFERNWNRGERGVQRTINFPNTDTYPVAFIPGGRWFLAWNDADTGGVVYYDFDTPSIPEDGHLLIPRREEERMIIGSDYIVDEPGEDSAFYLALEFLTPDQLHGQSRKHRDLEIWKITLNDEDQLAPTLVLSLPVFRQCPPQGSLSLMGDSLLRMSLAGSHRRRPVFTVHRWRGLEDDHATHAILIPKRTAYSSRTGQVTLLSDGRILSVSESWVEIYPPPDIPWQESVNVPENIPETAPQWTYDYPPSFDVLNHAVSRPLYAWNVKSTTFSIYTGEYLISMQIPLQPGTQPVVTSIGIGEKDSTNRMGLGTSRVVMSKMSEVDTTLIALDFRPAMRSLKTFAGVESCAPGTNDAQQVTETRFVAPFPSNTAVWLIDELSGRLFCTLGPDERQNMLFCFVD